MHVWAFYGIPTLKISLLDVYQVISIVGNGVDFFFVISGFCMYLMASGKSFSTGGYLHFLYKRFIRIAPAFYISVLVYALIIKYQQPAYDVFYNVVFHFLFLNNVVTGNTISAPFWSIGTEWHYYLILPLLMLSFRKYGVVACVLWFSLLSIALSCFVNLGFLAFDWWEKQIFIRFPEFGMGMIAAFYFKNKKLLPNYLKGAKGIFIAVGIIFLGRVMKFTQLLEVAGEFAFFINALALPIMTAGFAILLYHVITEHSKLSNWLSGNLINYLGRISYSIYLWHSLSIFFLAGVLNALPFKQYNIFAGFLLVSIATVIIAHFSYLLLESFYFKKKP